MRRSNLKPVGKETFLLDFLTEIGPHLAYFILLLGSFVEGESVVLTSGFLAYTGFLELKWVMLIAFCGTLFADQLLFFIGCRRGAEVLARHPAWQARVQKIFALLHKYDVLFILSFRFIYGIRTLSPFVIGTAGVSIKRFVILNFVAAVLWTFISCGAGYMLGYFFADSIEQILSQIGHYQKIIFLTLGILIIAVAAITYSYRKLLQKRKKKKNGIDPMA